jgi:PAS domain S-box-containing protein
MYDEAGQLVRMIGTLVDITQRKQAEIALREEAAKLNLFIKYAPVSVAMFDRQMCYLAASQRWLKRYHLGSEETVIGRSHYEIFPNISDTWKQNHQKGLAGATQKCDQDYFILPDGSEQWLNWEIQPWRFDNGKIGGILIFIEDITERKQAEIALQNQLTRERLVTNIAQNIRETLELDQVLQRTVDQVRKLLQADRAIIFHFQPDWTGTVITESVGNDYLSILNSNIYDPCFAQSYIEPYRQGFVTTRTDFYADDIDPCYLDLMKPFQVRANLAVPILIRTRIMGFINYSSMFSHSTMARNRNSTHQTINSSSWYCHQTSGVI